MTNAPALPRRLMSHVCLTLMLSLTAAAAVVMPPRPNEPGMRGCVTETDICDHAHEPIWREAPVVANENLPAYRVVVQVRVGIRDKVRAALA